MKKKWSTNYIRGLWFRRTVWYLVFHEDKILVDYKTWKNLAKANNYLLLEVLSSN